ncbi:hypothetical protein HDG40_000017 [Paraburkholderia sp. JPY158]|uniref:Glycosyl transferase family 1 domain-containing protein n=1 Tax=Paraburkholderia atlantica TaxID=2654982 RepID=A0A7W8Q1B0_PARAM|nr:glycosyltransferase family 1 protein [Paraburkholderia atlantica]MBB5421876.1 hypothetical protein [Paraburkholderia atlantica]
MVRKKILLEMRPALDGFAGIPQETRLLFRGIKTLNLFDVEGLLQHSGRYLSKGTKYRAARTSKRFAQARQINRVSRSIISLQEQPRRSTSQEVLDHVRKQFGLTLARLSALIGGSLKLTHFDPKLFHDFVWRNLFAKTLPPSDFELVTQSHFRVLRMPWKLMHRTGLKRTITSSGRYLNVDTNEFDYFIAQTPYPGRVSGNTTFIVRYHDALPILMPHTIGDKSFHQAAHYNALKSNVRDGAYFACVSKATRDDLLSIFPEAADRAHVIPNMVSHDYYPEESSPARVPEIIKSRTAAIPRLNNTSLQPMASKRSSPGTSFNYLLVVSTIEPRKNHTRLLESWEALRSDGYPDLKLVVVGSPGWDYAPILESFLPWIERGDLYYLSKVPSPDLRVLYKHARATICPSLGEGFDYSGVEAMRSGGIVVASDIPVHREVYEDVAEYFDPYSTPDAARAIGRVLSPDFLPTRASRIEQGIQFTTRYFPEQILPIWKTFFQNIDEQDGRAP